LTMIVRRVARPLLATAFVAQGVETLIGVEQDASDVGPALKVIDSLPDSISSKIPNDAELVTQLNGVTQIAGGVLLATGRIPRVAAALLALTVVPANFGRHRFWTETDPLRKAQKRHAFLTDVSLLGGLILASADTAGKPSLSWRGRRAGQRAAETLLNALPSGDGSAQHEIAEKIGHAVQVGVDRGRDLAEAAAEKAGTAIEKGAPLAELAYQRGAQAAATAGKDSKARLNAGWRKLRTAAVG
jgi:uncharacterized membrane protein YphA (DoxX/SURF4 family)